MAEETAWKRKCLKGHIHVKHGFPFKSEHFARTGDLIVLTPGNFLETGGFKQQPGKEKFYTSTFPAEYLHEKGDLIVAMTEQAEGLLGSMALVPEANRYLHNQRIGKVTATSGEVSLEFLYHAFKTRAVREQLSNTASGSKVRHTSPERIYDVSILFPSVDEQERIARILATLDAKIDLNNRINAELEGLAMTIYDYWFVQFDFPDAKGRPYKTRGGKMVWNETLKREIPARWEESDISAVADVAGGATPSKAVPSYWQGNIPFFTPTDANGSVFQLTTEDSITQSGLDSCSSELFKKGTVFITARGSVGRLAIAGCAMGMNQSCYALKPKTPSTYPYVFLHAKMLIHHLKVKASGSTFNSIVTNDIEWTRLVSPEPAAIAEFCKMVRPIFDRIEAAQRENLELIRLRDWLLPLLMNGQVKPPEL